jgi:hypothetical protein
MECSNEEDTLYAEHAGLPFSFLCRYFSGSGFCRAKPGCMMYGPNMNTNQKHGHAKLHQSQKKETRMHTTYIIHHMHACIHTKRKHAARREIMR